MKRKSPKRFHRNSRRELPSLSYSLDLGKTESNRIPFFLRVFITYIETDSCTHTLPLPASVLLYLFPTLKAGNPEITPHPRYLYLRMPVLLLCQYAGFTINYCCYYFSYSYCNCIFSISNTVAESKEETRCKSTYHQNDSTTRTTHLSQSINLKADPF